MSYEYKEILKTAARDFLTGTLQQDSETGEYFNLGEVEDNYSFISIELDRVYAQAAKADEYEAKAKAFDSLKNKLEEEVRILSGNVSGFPYVDAPIDSSISHFERILEMMKNYESGESDEL